MSERIKKAGEAEPLSRKDKAIGCVAVGAFSALVVAALGGSVAFGVRQNINAYEARKAIEAKAFAPAKADGFELDSVDTTNNRTGFNIVIDLGNCQLAAEVERTMVGDSVTDLHNYSFDGYAMATDKAGREKIGKTYHNYTYNDGVPVTFTFENRADLETNILGPEPCKTLAQTYEPATSTARR